MSDILRDFDKKNEFPKVKLNLPKFDFSHLNEAVTNMNTIFDNIVKDIRDIQDNAMAMEFTKCIGELLKKNGVVPEITEYTANLETDNTFKARYGVTIDKLDFSEHDKVFEDRIAELKKDYRTVSELLGKYQQENESLKKRIIELENFSCQAEQETESLFEKLKQRIAELESKEIKKIMRIEFHADNGEMLTPLEVANSLINQNTFKVDELRELSEFLQVYCNHHEDRDIEPNIMLF